MKFEVIKRGEEKFSSDAIYSIVQAWYQSPDFEDMLEADKYYFNENAIKDKRRYTISSDDFDQPVKVENPILTNTRASNAFLTKLVDQKVAYTIGKDFYLLNDSVKQDDETFMLFEHEVNKRYTPNFRTNFLRAAKDSVKKGIGWLYVYYDDNGNLMFKRCEPSDIIPIWGDVNHTELKELIRCYWVHEWMPDGSNGRVLKVEYYTMDGVYRYSDVGKQLALTGMDNYLTVTDGETIESYNWNKFPWICLKYNSDEKGLLFKIKSLIDAYDRLESDYCDAIADTPNSLMVVKNYDGSNPAEFMKNASQYRTIFVQDDGDAKVLQSQLSHGGVEAMLTRLRKDIYSFGCGIDLDLNNIGNVSGVALKVLYADLNTDSMFWQGELVKSVEDILWFIKADIESKTGNKFAKVEYTVRFNTDEIFNEQEIIQSAAESSGIISQRTIVENHPWVDNIYKELSYIRDDEQRERVEELELTQEQAKALGINKSYTKFVEEAVQEVIPNNVVIEDDKSENVEI